jgi:hypothetical protein
LPPEPAPECIEFEEILITLGASDIAMIKSILDGEGITYYFQNESPYCFDLTRLMVRKDQADEAREILEGLKISEPLISGGSRSDDA